LRRCVRGATFHRADKRRSILLTDPQATFRQEQAARLGISVADLIRRIIDEFREAKGVRR
jgi:hypothetical protein